jgi:carboxymethylenebutenolidase
MVTTSADIQSEMMQYSSQDGTQIDAYLSQPATPGSYPGVIVTMEGMGLEDHMKELTRRFAEEGYIAIAPDLYTREGRPAPEKVLEVLFSVPDSQTMADLEGAATFLKSHSNANNKVGIIGFCSGGRYTLMFACTSSNVNAAVDSAGGHIIPDETTEARPVGVIDMIANLSCPLLGIFGEEDGNPSPAHAARLNEELDKHNKTYEYKMYANAGHAFFADYRPSYRAAPAQDMWHRVLLFYEKYLKN